MKKAISIFTAICFLLAVQSCSKETPTTLSYNANVKDLIDNRCLPCHGAVSPTGGLSLTNYEEVRQSTEMGSLLLRINDANNPMPRSGLMSQEDRDLIQNWANEGYQEN